MRQISAERLLDLLRTILRSHATQDEVPQDKYKPLQSCKTRCLLPPPLPTNPTFAYMSKISTITGERLLETKSVGAVSLWGRGMLVNIQANKPPVTVIDN